jgi:hypothetical protein
MEQKDMEPQKGSLIVGRIKGMPGNFIMFLVNVREGHIMEVSAALPEDSLRKLLASNYGETTAQIERRIQLAKAHPEI